MEIDKLSQIIADKDQLIAELKGQINNQTTQISEQSKQIGLLTISVQQLNEKLAAVLVAPNFTQANVNTTLNRCGKRRSETTDFRSGKNIRTNRSSSSNGILKYFSAGNSGNQENEIESMDSVSGNTNDDTEKSGEQHNPTSDANTNNLRQHNVSWADIVENEDENTVPKTKQTPIQIGKTVNDDYSTILASLRQKFGTANYEWIQLRLNVSPRIVCHDSQTKTNIMEFLKQSEIEYNTFADKSTKRKAFIVRGLIHGRDDDNIHLISEALADYHIDGVNSITRFLTPSMKRSENATPLYQLVLDANSNETRLGQVNTIDSFRVKFEKMHNTKVVQCRRCQRFSHTAASCAFKYRCVQCLQAHGPGNCPRITNKKIPIGCVNCAAAGLNHNNHTANDLKHCQYYGKIKNQKGVAAHTSSVKDTSKPNTKKQNPKAMLNSNRQTKAVHHNTLDDIHTPANNPSTSKRKLKRQINQFRPSVSPSGITTKNSKSNSNISLEAGGSSHSNKNELLQLFGRICELIQQTL